MNEQDNSDSNLKKAIKTIGLLHNKIVELQNEKFEPIAVVGMSCRFPGGSNNLATYWDLLSNGKDAIIEIPSDRWSLDEYYDSDPDAPNKMYCKWGGFLTNTNVQNFDAKFFDITALEAQNIDPQQRLALEVTWEALENARFNIDDLRESITGVFFGVSTSDYVDIVKDSTNINAYTNVGLSHSVLAGRISYELGLQGPSIALDTACSSSLVAIHQACVSLRLRECNVAIAGGVNLMLTPNATIGFCKGRYLAEDGRCKTFDDSANGYVRGEGCGVIVLKRLSDAKKDGDDILAVIKGSAVNQDGASGGLTVPNGLAQETVIRQALTAANIKPSDIDYIEAHGTGTPLGDPIELHALEHVLKEGRSKEQPLVVGSVKTNIGHLEAAAGVAGVIKIILALQHQQIPKHLNFKKLNHNINLDEDITVVIPIEKRAWCKDENRKRIAGISGFAFQGTNAHLIIEETSFDIAQENKNHKEKNYVERPLQFLAITAKSVEALQDLAIEYRNLIDSNKSPDFLENFAFTINTSRSKFKQRLTIIANDAEQASKKLKDWVTNKESDGVLSGENTNQGIPKIAFLFTGGGSQFSGMGKLLYDTSPTFKESIDKCATILSHEWEFTLQSILWGENSELLDRMDYMQPALFAFEYSMVQLWREWGIEPYAVIGHSLGEYVAATVAGVFSLEDGLTLIAKRSKLMHLAPGNGAMASIAASEEDVSIVLNGYSNSVTIAAINGPESILISGDREKVIEILEVFKARDVKVKLLPISNASHSPLMEPILTDFEKEALKVKFAPPKLNIISNIYGTLVSEQEICNAKYWTNHIRQTVKFADGMMALHDLGCMFYIEMGPHPMLINMGEENSTDPNSIWLPSARRHKSEWQQMLESLASLFINGVQINWHGFDKDYIREKIQIPTYPFQKTKYWVEQNKRKSSGTKNYIYPLIGNIARQSALHQNEIIFNTNLNLEMFPYFVEHKVYENIVIPGATYVEMVFESSLVLFYENYQDQSVNIILSNFIFEQPIALEYDVSRDVQIVFNQKNNDANNLMEINIFSRKNVPELNNELHSPYKWIRHASCNISCAKNSEVLNDSVEAIESIKNRCTEELFVDGMYLYCLTGGVDYGPSFRGIKKLFINDKEALAEVKFDADVSDYGYMFHPALLDACLQSILGIILNPKNVVEANSAYLPFEIQECILYKRASKNLWVHVTEVVLQSERVFCANLKIYNEENILLMKINGFMIAKADKDVLNERLHKQNDGGFYDNFYKPEWKQMQNIHDNKITLLKKAWILFTCNLQAANVFGKLIESHGHVVYYVVLDLVSKDASENNTAFNETEKIFNSKICSVDEFYNLLKIIDEKIKVEDIQKINVVNMFPLVDTKDEFVDEIQQQIYLSTLFLTQALVKYEFEKVRLYFISSGAKFVNKNQQLLNVDQSTIWGVARTIALEYPYLGCTNIDLDPESEILDNTNWLYIFDEICSDSIEDQVAYRKNARFVGRLERFNFSKVHDKRFDITSIEKNDLYIITGGLGGIGLNIAAWLVSLGCKNIALIGRSKPNDAAILKINELNERAGNVFTIALDIANYNTTFDEFSALMSKAYNIRGIIHAAGTVSPGSLMEQNREKYLQVIAPKIYGVINLQKCIEKLNLNLDFFVNFSSASSLMGNANESNYSAANAFLDSYTHYQRRKGVPSFSINWGFWQGIGLIAASNSDEDKRLMESFGIYGFNVDDGMKALQQILEYYNDTQIMFNAVNWNKYIQSFSNQFTKSYFSDVAHIINTEKTQEEAIGGDGFIDEILKIDESERKQYITDYLQKLIQEVLGLQSLADVDITEGFMSMGIDSILAVELQKRIKQYLGSSSSSFVSPTILFNYPNIDQLSDYLVHKINSTNKKDVDPTVPTVVQIESKEELPQIELTDEQIDNEIEKVLKDVDSIIDGVKTKNV